MGEWMVWYIIKHGNNFVIKHPNRSLQGMFLYLQLTVLNTRAVLTKDSEGLEMGEQISSPEE
jgi:hypothetical protein